jgi:hypothetical protein
MRYISTRSLRYLPALVLTASLTTRAEAQIADVQRSAVADISRLTFGYLCDDTFVLRNDGDKAVTASLGVTKSGEQTALALAAHEQVQFTSKSKEDVELWVDGKLVAKAEKEKRGCKDVQGNASVAVAPLEVSGDTDKGRRSLADYPYFDPWFYGAYGPWGAWGGGFGAWGYRPFYTGYVGVPIIVGNRGGGGRRR